MQRIARDDVCLPRRGLAGTACTNHNEASVLNMAVPIAVGRITILFVYVNVHVIRSYCTQNDGLDIKDSEK